MLRSTAYWPILTAVVGITSLGNAVGGQQLPLAQPGRMSAATPISFRDAKPILERLAASLPPELAGKSPSELESAWGDWVSRRNREIRARLERGDEDSIVNFLLFGTTFTSLPRALNDSARIGGRQRAAEVVRGRTADLIAGYCLTGWERATPVRS